MIAAADADKFIQPLNLAQKSKPRRETGSGDL